MTVSTRRFPNDEAVTGHRRLEPSEKAQSNAEDPTGTLSFASRGFSRLDSLAEIRYSTEVPSVGQTTEDVCSACGCEIDTSSWHPVVADEGEADLCIRVFCCDACRETWLDE